MRNARRVHGGHPSPVGGDERGLTSGAPRGLRRRSTAVGLVGCVVLGMVWTGQSLLGVADAAAPGGGTTPSPVVTVGAVGVVPTAIVRATIDPTTVAVSTTISVTGLLSAGSSTSTTTGNCSAVRSGSLGIVNYAKSITETTDVVNAAVTTVTAADGTSSVTLSLGEGKYMGSLPARSSDGSATVTVTAAVSQVVDTTVTQKTQTFAASDSSCTGTSSTTTNSESTTSKTYSDTDAASASYVVDVVPPTMTAGFAGGGVPSAPTGGDISAKAEVANGKSGDAFTLTLRAIRGTYSTVGSLPTPLVTDISGSTSGTISSQGKEMFASVSLGVPCSAALGTYTLVATATGLADASGTDFDPVTVIIGQFAVEPSVNLVGTTSVFGFVTVDGGTEYTNLDTRGFTAVQAKRAVNTSPGAFHSTNLMKTTGQCNTDTTMSFNLLGADGNPTSDITLQAPAGFEFVATGKTFAKVYAGKLAAGALFDFEKPALTFTHPVSGVSVTGEVNSLLGDPLKWQQVESSNTVLKVKLDELKSIPADGYVYLRVRMRYIGTSVPEANKSFPVIGTVSVDGYNGSAPGASKSNTYLLVHAPTPTA